MLKAGVDMRLESEVDNHRVMVAVDVRIHAVQAFEDLAG